MNGNFKRNLVISSGISLLILLISSTASYLSIRSLLHSNGMVNHTEEVIYNLNEGRASTIEAQNDVRGFLLTGKTMYIKEIDEEKKNGDAFLDKVAELTVDNPAQQRDLKLLIPQRKAFFDYLYERIESKTNGFPVLASDLASGKELLNVFRTTSKRIEGREQLLLKERIAQSERNGSYSALLIVVAAMISIVISLVFFVRILRDFKQRVLLQRELESKDLETAQRISVISHIASQISRGNYEIRVDDTQTDALGSVSDSLNTMARSLDESFTQLSEKEWLQAGIAQLNNVMIGEKTPEQLTTDIIEQLANYTGSSAAVLYLLEGETLRATAGYSYVPNQKRDRLKIGEGLSGQAVASMKLLELKKVSTDDITISYALGEAKPTHIVAVPLIDETVSGVVELASIKGYLQTELDFLSSVANNIGIAIKAAQNRKRVQELLEETESQSEELRMQHTELESMNSELETQTEKLQASEEELRVQQEELQQTNEELAERSVLLEERNIEIQKKSEDLELTTRYKSEFLANMSHELRTPLNSILLLSRLLSENNDANMNAEQIEFAKVIQNSGNGLLGLIDEILDLSKIEAGKMELEFIDISVKEIADGMKDLFSPLAKEKNITFEIVDNDAPVVIRTDKMRLEQILKNLISNAVKFTSKGSVTLTIRNHRENDKLVCFSVKDTGIGIPAEKQHLIFEAFQQADGSTKRKFGGTGLGLSISRELAKLLKGTISLKSESGKGSDFTVCVPITGVANVLPTDDNETYQTSVETNNQQTELPKYRSATIPHDVADDRNDIKPTDKVILIVEDDTNFAKSLLEFTRNRKYKGIVCVRGDHALDMAMVYKPIGILLDIELPMKSGWEVMDELKNNWQTKHIPVHIMSSHKLKQESLLKGAVNFLDKPVAFEQMPEVFKKIEQIITKESQKVLIIEDNTKHAKALSYFLESNSINSEIKSNVNDGVKALHKKDVDCVILDMGIPDQQAYAILEDVKKTEGLEKLPVIVFTGKSLSMQEELRIKKYADSIVVKTAHSYQRMLDEVSLFLHLVEENKKKNANTDVLRKGNLLNNILHNKTVLVVDDDVRNIYSLTKALEALKMNVITAIDGKEALVALEKNPETDVVLLDMMMPNMDGYETARRIRDDKKLKNLPVIAVTAKAMTGDREKCISAGASDYITKPVDVDQLMSLLRVWLYDKI